MKSKEYFAKPLFRFLDTVGNGTGTKNAIGNYGTPNPPEQFLINPGSSVYVITSLIIHIADTGLLSAGGYGAGSSLSNGISIAVHNATSSTNNIITDMINIKTNGDFGRYCCNVDVSAFGTGLNYVNARFDFTKTGSAIRLAPNSISSPSVSLRVTLTDDFTGLIEHYFYVKGYIEGELL